MTEDIRIVKEGTQYQGEDEKIRYSITTTPWGSDPTNVSVKVYNVSTGSKVDVSATVLTDTASVEGDVITLPFLEKLTAGSKYRIEVSFTSGGNVFEVIIPVQAQA